MKVGVFVPELLRHLFKKPATVDYPFKKLVVPEGFRGTPQLTPALCIVCKACERDCPAEAIEITPVNEADKTFRMIIHNDRCIHCAQCVDSCPTAALAMDALFEIADDDRHKLKKDWVYPRAVIKPKAAPKPAPAAAKPEAPQG